MNDRTNESLSALIDGETDELEVRRLLNQLEDDAELRARWSRYQMIGALMRNEPAAGVDLSRGIMQAIEGEPMDEVARPQSAAATPVMHRMRWLASGAVAATVTLAVLVGVNGLQQEESDTGLQMAAVVTDMPVAAPALVSTNQPQIQLASSEAPAMEPEQLEEAQRKLQEYIMQHTEQATMGGNRGIMPYARVVNFGTAEEQR